MTLPTVVNSYASGFASSSSSTVVVSPSLASASNGKLIAVVSLNVNETVDSVSSSVGGAFSSLGTILCTESSSFVRLAFFELLNPASGAHTITATRSGISTARFYMVLVHVQGAQQVASTLSAGTTLTTDQTTYTDSVTTTVADSLVIGADVAGGATTGATASVTEGSGQTALQSLIPGSTLASLAVSSKDAPVAGAITCSWQWDVSQRRSAALALAIPPAGSSGGGSSAPFFMLAAGL